MPRVVSRVVLAVVALLAAGWLAVSWRNARLQEKATAVVLHETIAPDEAEDARRWLDRASFLNPDRTPEIGLGVLALRIDRPREAERRARVVLDAEPERSDARNLLLQARRAGG
jgi:hypothetical protein